jgi:hypothetical protein
MRIKLSFDGEWITAWNADSAPQIGATLRLDGKRFRVGGVEFAGLDDNDREPDGEVFAEVALVEITDLSQFAPVVDADRPLLKTQPA